ncbi:MAG: hypothetical protein JST00_00735 [Deltaproteobacteria bacterium]|nr:hypothetical protein [Deltaproteobacteria bacterium]
MTYREPSEAPEERDLEAIAIAELGRRAGRARAVFIVSVLVVGIGAGVVLYLALRELQLAMLGAHIPYLTGALTMFPAFGGAMRLGPRLADAYLAKRLPTWREELAKAHGLDLASLEETTKLLE